MKAETESKITATKDQQLQTKYPATKQKNTAEFDKLGGQLPSHIRKDIVVTLDKEHLCEYTGIQKSLEISN
jgi:hypothetical protein